MLPLAPHVSLRSEGVQGYAKANVARCAALFDLCAVWVAGAGEAVDAGPAARLRGAHLRHRKGRQRRDLQVGALLYRCVVVVVDAGIFVVGVVAIVVVIAATVVGAVAAVDAVGVGPAARG